MARKLAWVCALGMEAGAWYPWVLAAYGSLPGSGQAPPWWAWAALLAAAAGLRRAVAGLARPAQTLAVVGGGLAAIAAGAYAADPLLWLGGATAYLAFWRGLAAAGHAGDPQLTPTVAARLLAALLAVLALSLLSGSPAAAFTARAWPHVALYCAAALLGLALSRHRALLRRGDAGEPPATDLLPAAGAVAALFGATTLLVAWGAGAPFAELSRRLATGLGWLGGALFGLLAPLLRLLGPVIEAAVALLRRLLSGVPPPAAQEATVWHEGDLAELSRGELPAHLVRTIEWLLLAAAVALAVWVLLRALRRRGRPAVGADGVPEERESLFAWQRAGQAWRPSKARRRRADPLPAGTAGEARRLFRRLQRLGARSCGRPRRAAETPSAYGKALSDGPLPGPAAAEVARLYDAVRYGGHRPDAAEVAAARAQLAAAARLVERGRTPTPR